MAKPTIYIADDLLRSIDMYARAVRQTRSRVVAEALRRYLSLPLQRPGRAAPGAGPQRASAKG